jgi:hypothetical protein
VIGEIIRKVRKGFQIEKCMITPKNSSHRNAAPVHRIEAMFVMLLVESIESHACAEMPRRLAGSRIKHVRVFFEGSAENGA